MTTPADLLLIYNALLSSTFSGYPADKHTAEEIAHIIYYRMQEEEKSTEVPVYTEILGPFRSASDISQSLTQMDGVKASTTHTHTTGTYLLLKCSYSAHSLIRTLPPHFLVLSSSTVYTLRLNSPPKHFPSELFISTVPTTIVQVANLHSTMEDILLYLDTYTILSVKYQEHLLHVSLSTLEESADLYSSLLGSTVNSHHTFVSYYPKHLADIQILDIQSRDCIKNK